MKLQSAEDVMAVAKARGFQIKMNPGPPPMPVLVNPESRVDERLHATEALLGALRAWRLEIIALLEKDNP